MTRGELYDATLESVLKRACNGAEPDPSWYQGVLGLLKECREAALIPELEAVKDLRSEIRQLKDKIEVIAAAQKLRTMGGRLP